ncbi:DUF4113 domain-containing protein [Arthrobacter globiformis]|uniref:DUF4113 domain-containing protein n=1 Tax=Arthrobacter globiformis TaxID=1665 RepID=UPI00345EC73A
MRRRVIAPGTARRTCDEYNHCPYNHCPARAAICQSEENSRKYGWGTLGLGFAGLRSGPDWSMKRGMRSPRAPRTGTGCRWFAQSLSLQTRTASR